MGRPTETGQQCTPGFERCRQFVVKTKRDAEKGKEKEGCEVEKNVKNRHQNRGNYPSCSAPALSLLSSSNRKGWKVWECFELLAEWTAVLFDWIVKQMVLDELGG